MEIIVIIGNYDVYVTYGIEWRCGNPHTFLYNVEIIRMDHQMIEADIPMIN